MRKLLAFFICILIFLFAITFDSGGILQGEGVHEFYLLSASSNAEIVRVNENSAKDFIYFKPHLKGESVIFYDDKKVSKLKLKFLAKKVFEERDKDFSCEYYYSPLIKNFVYINGEKVNLHFSQKNGITTVGTPIIFGGF